MGVVEVVVRRATVKSVTGRSRWSPLQLVAGMTLVVKDVPAEICKNCGERYFDADVTQELLRIARAAVADGVVVDVRRYVAA